MVNALGLVKRQIIILNKSIVGFSGSDYGARGSVWRLGMNAT